MDNSSMDDPNEFLYYKLFSSDEEFYDEEDSLSEDDSSSPKKGNEPNTQVAIENVPTNDKTLPNQFEGVNKPEKEPEPFNNILLDNENGPGIIDNKLIGNKRYKSDEEKEKPQETQKRDNHNNNHLNYFFPSNNIINNKAEDSLTSYNNICSNTTHKNKIQKNKDKNANNKIIPLQEDQTNSKINGQQESQTKVQVNGRPGINNIYKGKRNHKSYEMGNRAKTISKTNSYEMHNFICHYIQSHISDQNITINLEESTDYIIAKVTIKNVEGKSEDFEIKIHPPHVTKLIDGNGGSGKRPKDPDNEYDMTSGLINRYFKLEQEEIYNLYYKYSCPKKLPDPDEKQQNKNLSEFEIRKIACEKYRQKMKFFLETILATEDGKEEKPLHYLFKLKFVVFRKIFFDYDEELKTVKEVSKKLYGEEQTKLENFRVYEECKNEFSSKEKVQKKFRDYFIDLIEGKIPRNSKNVK